MFVHAMPCMRACMHVCLCACMHTYTPMVGGFFLKNVSSTLPSSQTMISYGTYSVIVNDKSLVASLPLISSGFSSENQEHRENFRCPGLLLIWTPDRELYISIENA